MTRPQGARDDQIVAIRSTINLPMEGMSSMTRLSFAKHNPV